MQMSRLLILLERLYYYILIGFYKGRQNVAKFDFEKMYRAELYRRLLTVYLMLLKFG
jgi:hypothetical protein